MRSAHPRLPRYAPVQFGGMTSVSSQAYGAQRRLRVCKIMDSKII